MACSYSFPALCNCAWKINKQYDVFDLYDKHRALITLCNTLVVKTYCAVSGLKIHLCTEKRCIIDWNIEKVNEKAMFVGQSIESSYWIIPQRSSFILNKYRNIEISNIEKQWSINSNILVVETHRFVYFLNLFWIHRLYMKKKTPVWYCWSLYKRWMSRNYNFSTVLNILISITYDIVAAQKLIQLCILERKTKWCS